MIITESDGVTKLSIKLEKKKLDDVLNIPPPFLNRNAIYMVSAPMGSGKTAFVNSIITNSQETGRVFYKIFERVIIIIPYETIQQDTEHVFSKHKRIYHTYDVDTLMKVEAECLENKRLYNGNTLILIDDFSESYKHKKTSEQLQKMINKHRHLKATIIMTTVILKNVPKNIRSLVDVWFIFKVRSIQEMLSVNDDIFGEKIVSLKAIMDAIYKEDYDYMAFNGKTKKYYRNNVPLQLDYELI